MRLLSSVCGAGAEGLRCFGLALRVLVHHYFLDPYDSSINSVMSWSVVILYLFFTNSNIAWTGVGTLAVMVLVLISTPVLIAYGSYRGALEQTYEHRTLWQYLNLPSGIPPLEGRQGLPSSYRTSWTCSDSLVAVAFSLVSIGYMWGFCRELEVYTFHSSRSHEAQSAPIFILIFLLFFHLTSFSETPYGRISLTIYCWTKAWFGQTSMYYIDK